VRTLFVCSFSLVAFAVPVAADAQEASRNWTGFYAGLHAGAGATDASNTPVTAESANPNIVQFFDGSFFPRPEASLGDGEGFVGGGQAGYNTRFGGLVVGLEGDLSYADLESSSSRSNFEFGSGFGFGPITTKLDQQIDWLATLRGRIGFVPTENLLIYGTAGVVLASVDTSLTYDNESRFIFSAGLVGSTVVCLPNRVCFSGSEDDTRTGWTVGGGFEYALSDKWSFKTDYKFVDLGSQDVKATGTAASSDNSLNTSVDTELHIVNLGLNFHFD
jgi:outer membrane immunogenic protein